MAAMTAVSSPAQENSFPTIAESMAMLLAVPTEEGKTSSTKRLAIVPQISTVHADAGCD